MSSTWFGSDFVTAKCETGNVSTFILMHSGLNFLKVTVATVQNENTVVWKCKTNIIAQCIDGKKLS